MNFVDKNESWVITIDALGELKRLEVLFVSLGDNTTCINTR
jgi:hypothetical protein